MQETEYGVTVWTPAPLNIVWDEMRSLDRILENIATVSTFDVQANGRLASCTGALARWPAAWRALSVDTELLSIDEPERLVWAARVPELTLEFTGTFTLGTVGRDETNITYVGSLRCGRRPACVLRHVLSSILECHVDSLATRFATRAARRNGAERALGGLVVPADAARRPDRPLRRSA